MGQELGRETISIKSEEREAQEENAIIAIPYFNFGYDVAGPFDARRYMIPINLTDINLSGGNQPLDILALGAAEARFKESQINQSNLPLRQLEQIRAHVKIFSNEQRISWDRSSNDLQYYGRNTPDGGIRNEAMEDIRQPMVNPFYGVYGRGYYHNPYSRGLYYYRR